MILMATKIPSFPYLTTPSSSIQSKGKENTLVSSINNIIQLQQQQFFLHLSDQLSGTTASIIIPMEHFIIVRKVDGRDDIAPHPRYPHPGICPILQCWIRITTLLWLVDFSGILTILLLKVTSGKTCLPSDGGIKTQTANFMDLG